MSSSFQLLIASSKSWTSQTGMCHYYVRHSCQGEWKQEFECNITLGKGGMAWGRGLHLKPIFEGPEKKEGDGCTPAGLFSLGPAFGKRAPGGCKFDYHFLSPHIEAVDDPHSLFYNQIVDRNQITHPDWQSSEKMSSVDLYEMGIVIQHNPPPSLPYVGSAIFIHLWRNDREPTAGCIGMSSSSLDYFFSSLDPHLNPLLCVGPFAGT